ncbi:MAG: response regulator [Candidatus Rokubacteria bacterium]|nr:response regulator [Candidatus Rokubacteria bacterium]
MPMEQPAPMPQERSRGKRVLVVDDEWWLADLAREILTADGHEVDTASNGRGALRKIQERPYDLIVCDVRMPELDGPSLYRELARHEPDPLGRFVFMTGAAHDAATAAFLEQTGAPCLRKPFTVDDLRHVTQRILGSG